MALTPQSSEAFVREVDEELRRDQLAGLWARHGKALIAAVVLVLAAVGGGLWWKAHRDARTEASAEALVAALQPVSEIEQTAEAQRAAKVATATAALAKLKDAGPLYGSAARLTAAALLSQQHKGKEAAAAFRAIAADPSAPQPYRDISTLRAVALDFDRMEPQRVIAQLKPLAASGSAWFGTASELTALAQIKAGQLAQARITLRALQRDLTVPQSIRDRTAQIGQSIDPNFSAGLVAVPKP